MFGSPALSLTRRTTLALLGSAAISAMLPFPALADDADLADMPFSFDALTERMRLAAGRAYEEPNIAATDAAVLPASYDEYRLVQFDADKARWSDAGDYRIHAFPLGWLYAQPVKLFDVTSGTATPMAFDTDDFRYHGTMAQKAGEAHADLPGVAGFRVNHPINSDAFDELMLFLGASYYRALGHGNVYGASARGLIIDCWLDGPEEFPNFKAFYLERPKSADAPLTIYAELDGPSVTGAYRFVVTPAGPDRPTTDIDVTARLFFREDVRELGIGPITSMFLFAENNRDLFDDYRPQVHDSDGLRIETGEGEVMWRALNNTPGMLGNSYLRVNELKSFGLYQRDRHFDSYQDPGAAYEKRPSIEIVPQSDWGPGIVRLVEIPATLESDDNINTFFIPETPISAGDEREFAYRVRVGDLAPGENAPLARVVSTRAGQGGVSGVENPEELRKFVVDFAGGPLDGIEPNNPPDILVSVSGAVVSGSTLFKIEENGVWRLVMDIDTSEAALAEIKAYLVSGGQRVSETWLYQNRKTHEV